MKLSTLCTERKLMVQRLAEHTGLQAVYLKTPTYAFRLGDGLIIERDGSIFGDCEHLKPILPFLLENGYINAIPDWAADSGASEGNEEKAHIEISEEPANEDKFDSEADEPTEASEEPANEDEFDSEADEPTEASEEPADEDEFDSEAGEQIKASEEPADADELDSKADGHVEVGEVHADKDELDSEENEEPAVETATSSRLEMVPVEHACVSVRLADLTPGGFVNLLKLIYARQNLIAAMTRSGRIFIDEELMDLLHDEKPDSVSRVCELLEGEIMADMARGIGFDEEQFFIEFTCDPDQHTRTKHCETLMQAIIDRAQSAHHISGKRLDFKEDEEKYFARNWLIQLGLGGAEHRETQQALIQHLHGYAAFRSADQMAAHKARHTALRREQREKQDMDQSR